MSAGVDRSDGRDVDELRERVVGHVRTDPEARRGLERLEERNRDKPLGSVARVLLAWADGTEPDRPDLETLLALEEPGDLLRGVTFG